MNDLLLAYVGMLIIFHNEKRERWIDLIAVILILVAFFISFISF